MATQRQRILDLSVTIVPDSEPTPAYLALWRRLLLAPPPPPLPASAPTPLPAVDGRAA